MTIEQNVFDVNRYAIAGGSRAGDALDYSGYTARDNLLLAGGGRHCADSGGTGAAMGGVVLGFLFGILPFKRDRIPQCRQVDGREDLDGFVSYQFTSAFFRSPPGLGLGAWSSTEDSGSRRLEMKISQGRRAPRETRASPG